MLRQILANKMRNGGPLLRGTKNCPLGIYSATGLRRAIRRRATLLRVSPCPNIIQILPGATGGMICLHQRTIGGANDKLKRCEILATICELIGPTSRAILVGAEQSPHACTCLAGWNVCTSCSRDVRGVAQLGSYTVDDWLGVPQLYFCALRNVEGATQKIEDTSVFQGRLRTANDAFSWGRRSTSATTAAAGFLAVRTLSNCPFGLPAFTICWQ